VKDLTIAPRPFLKWAGNKSKLLAQYAAYLPQPATIRTYYEPFLGGGAIFFHLRPSAAVLADINPALVNVYRCVQQSVEVLIEKLTIHQQCHSQDYYYQVRAAMEGDAVTQAARLLYLNKTCFNGLYRENSQGKFNVPMGRYKNPLICNPDLLRSASVALQSATIALGAFHQVCDRAIGPDDFVYFDPPYHPISATSRFTDYNRFGFRKEDQIALSQVCQKLVDQGVRLMLSNSDCEFIRNLYHDFYIWPISAPRTISADATKRGEVREILVTSYRPAQPSSQAQLSSQDVSQQPVDFVEIAT